MAGDGIVSESPADELTGEHDQARVEQGEHGAVRTTGQTQEGAGDARPV